MWDIRDRDETDLRQDTLTFVLGAAGGFAVGMLLSGRGRTQGAGMLRERAGGLRERARSVAARLRPQRLRRALPERNALEALEDSVLDAFLRDDVLSERGIDVGAISQGIVELSGSVWTEEESRRAVSLAQRVPGVDTVVNRLDVEDDQRIHDRGPLHDDESARAEREWTGRNIGMGRSRKSRDQNPPRPDDSQHIREVSLEDADQDEFEWAGFAANARMGERPEVQDGKGRVHGYSEGDLDNQEPTGPHTYGGTAREPHIEGQQFNTASRVGDGLKPGEELRLEAADLPVKPHGKQGTATGEDGGRGHFG